MTGRHRDPRRAAEVIGCLYCKRDTMHTVYRSGALTATRCRRCRTRFERVWSAPARPIPPVVARTVHPR